MARDRHSNAPSRSCQHLHRKFRYGVLRKYRCHANQLAPTHQRMAGKGRQAFSFDPVRISNPRFVREISGSIGQAFRGNVPDQSTNCDVRFRAPGRAVLACLREQFEPGNNRGHGPDAGKGRIPVIYHCLRPGPQHLGEAPVGSKSKYGVTGKRKARLLIHWTLDAF
jgi:hypothetical protein